MKCSTCRAHSSQNWYQYNYVLYCRTNLEKAERIYKNKSTESVNNSKNTQTRNSVCATSKGNSLYFQSAEGPAVCYKCLVIPFCSRISLIKFKQCSKVHVILPSQGTTSYGKLLSWLFQILSNFLSINLLLNCSAL